MSELYSVTPLARRKPLPEEFLGSMNPSDHDEVFRGADLQGLGVSSDLDALEAAIGSVIERYPLNDTRMDGALALPIHSLLRIDRATAADMGLWVWLATTRFPAFTAHRWFNGKEQKTPADRFGVNRVRNGLSRLWWAAELTRVDDDYSLTEEFFALPGAQDLYEALFGRAFLDSAISPRALITTLGYRREKVIRETCKQLNVTLATTLLEDLQEDELVELCTQLADAVEQRLAAGKSEA